MAGFQSEDDVREYLENIGIEYRFQCYSEKRPDGCQRLGDFLEAVKNDYVKSAIVYQQTCDKYSFGRSCFKAGNYRFLGRGCDQNGEISYGYYRKACDNDFPTGCYQAGIMKWNGQLDVPTDQAESRKLFERGCNGNDPDSCYFLGTTYLPKDGQPSSLIENADLAFKWTEKACRLNHSYACANLYQLYKNGLGCQASEEMANQTKKKALALQDLFQRHDPGVVFGEG